MVPSKIVLADGLICFLGVILAMIGVIGIPSTDAGQAASAAWSTIKLPSTRFEVHQGEFETRHATFSASVDFTLSGVCVFMAEHAFENVPMHVHTDHCWQWDELGDVTGLTSGTCEHVEAMIPPQAAPLSNVVRGYCVTLKLWALMSAFTIIGFMLCIFKMLVAFAAIGLDGNDNYPKCTYVVKRLGLSLAWNAAILLLCVAIIYGSWCYINPDYEQLALILPQIPGAPPDGRIPLPVASDVYITMEVAQELVRNVQSAFGPAFMCTLFASLLLTASGIIGNYIRLQMVVTANGGDGAANDATVELRKQDGASVHAQAGP